MLLTTAGKRGGLRLEDMAESMALLTDGERKWGNHQSVNYRFSDLLLFSVFSVILVCGNASMKTKKGQGFIVMGNYELSKYIIRTGDDDEVQQISSWALQGNTDIIAGTSPLISHLISPLFYPWKKKISSSHMPINPWTKIGFTNFHNHIFTSSLLALRMVQRLPLDRMIEKIIVKNGAQ